MFKNKKSLLSKFILAKDEFVSMKLHFRYHTYLYTKKGGTVHDGCKYCQNGLVNSNVEAANENKSEEVKKVEEAESSLLQIKNKKVLKTKGDKVIII